jgi:hypothetical protein
MLVCMAVFSRRPQSYSSRMHGLSLLFVGLVNGGIFLESGSSARVAGGLAVGYVVLLALCALLVMRGLVFIARPRRLNATDETS